MPFQNSEGKVIWVSPSDDEVIINRIALSADAAPDEVVIPEELASQLSKNFTKNENVAVEAEKLARYGPVDIIIPVHNGLHVLKKCINSVLKHTNYPFNLIVVDDASDSITSDWLENDVETWVTDYLDRCEVVSNKKNRGFAATCNRGADRGTSPYIVFLNSDVIVTPGWLTKLVRAAEADPRNAIVNPATNNTAMVNIPLRDGMSYLQMNQMLETRTPSYPEIMPTGFCFFFKRSVWDQLGGLDEGFVSYGEESDFWMRTLKCIDRDTGEFPQYRAVMADDSYVFHERGSSFSVKDPDEWMGERKKGNSRFHLLHPDYRRIWYRDDATEKRLDSLRKMDITNFKASIKDDAKYNIAWLVYSTVACGGMKFISDIVNELQERGVNAQIVQIKRDPKLAMPPPLGELRSAPIYFDNKQDCIDNFTSKVFDNGIIVSATGELGDAALVIERENENIQALNHLQSWDIGQTNDETTKNTLKDIYQRFSKTITNANWLTEALRGVEVKGEIETVQPGVDTDIFYPRAKAYDDRPTVMLVLNPMYPFKGADRGAQVAVALEKLSKAENKPIRLIGLGVHKVEGMHKIMCIPEMPPTRLAKMLGEEVDLLFDPSYLHTYGLPCAEAVGIREYADDTLDVVLPNDASPDEMAQAIWDKLFDVTPAACRVNNIPPRDEQVEIFIEKLEGMFDLEKKNKASVCFITPHMRKFGGPTTIVTTANDLAARGYDTSICSVYRDSVNLELTNTVKVPLVFGLENMPKCDVVIVPSDSDQHQQIEAIGKYNKRILLKLGHNERFKVLEELGLQTDYDAVFTSTQWVKEVCETPTKGWNYPSRRAHRIGWVNYEFERFDTSPAEREYNQLGTTSVTICGLIHNHPLKGTKDFMSFAYTMREKFGDKVQIIAIGEAEAHNKLRWLQYIKSPSRRNLAEIARRTDIFMSFSHTEGLGRLPLEFMSAGAAVVASDTGCEFLGDEKNCLLFPIGDTATAYNQTVKLMSDIELFSKVVQNGYLTAKATGDSTRYIDTFSEKLEEVLRA
jgi:GT2 family glycosyltransferase/glycosyltransferase involved in cell wall biosynthesis